MTFIETSKGRLELRELVTIGEMVAAEQIQYKVWGDIIVHPKELLIPVQHEGGLLAGAFASDGEMIGMIFSFPTKDPTVMHSQMLATLEEWRGQGIGTRMKWYQRDWCLEHGFRLLRWTVDPLRSANAELNIRHLGSTASTYLTDYYGVMAGIDAGAPTDRLLIEWQLDSDRVQQRAVQTPEDRGFPHASYCFDVIEEDPANLKLDLSAPAILLRLPKNYITLSQIEPEHALNWRIRTREIFLHYFAAGYCVTEFTRVGGPAYLLEKEPLK